MTDHTPEPEPEPMATAADVIDYLLTVSEAEQRAVLESHPEAVPVILAEARAQLADATEPPSIVDMLDRRANGWPIVPDDARNIHGGA